MKVRLPFLKLDYSWARLGGDFAGGVVAALIALPYGLAMASLMGLPPILGVFTSILTSPVISLLGRNAVLVGGTGSVTVPFIAAAVASQGIGGAAKVSIVAAVIMMAFCVMRLGRHIMRVPHAVVTGFSCGVGAMMLISQLGIISGTTSPFARQAGSAVAQLAAFFSSVGDFQPAVFVTGIIVIIGATMAARVSPMAPAPLIGILLAVGAGKAFGFHEPEVGRLSLELPPFIGFSWKPLDVFTVLPSAFALAFVTSVNLLLTSRVVEHFRGRHHRAKKADADAELGAYGIANVFAGMFGAPLSVGIPARSLAVVRCGGSTKLANLFHALVLIFILRYGSEWIAHIPMAAMAGVTAWMGICLLDWSAWRRLRKMARVDATAFLATAFAVITMNAVLAVVIGCSVYGVRALYYRIQGDGHAVPDLQLPSL